MATQTPDIDDRDSKYNPGDLHAAEQFPEVYTSAGADQAEVFANDPSNATKEREENPTDPNSLNYTGGNSDSEKSTFSFRGMVKKKGPLGLVIGLLLGGVGGLTVLFSPGIAIVHLKEVLTGDLNDQFAAMDIRTAHVFKAKLNNLSKGGALCQTTGIRCKFKGMSDRQIKKFKAAGIDVKTDGKGINPLGRNKVTEVSFKDSSGKTIKLNDAKGINRLMNDRVVRDSFRRGFNPKFAGFYDAVSAKVFSKFRTNKAEKVTGDTDKERDAAVDDDVKGTANLGESKVSATDDDGKVDEEKTKANTSAEGVDKSVLEIEPGKGVTGAFSSVKDGALKGALITGVADTTCTVKQTATAVGSSAKIIRAAQLARFAMIFLNFADQVKAGTATPDQASYVGNKLTAVDTNEKIINENSKLSNGIPTKVTNPDYGKNAFDSDGFKAAAYNEAPSLSARSQQFTVGGGLVGSLSGVLNKLKVGKTTCKVLQNGFVRAGSLVIGVATGAVTFGLSFAAQVGGSIAVSMALPLLKTYLADMLAGKTVSSSTDGVDAGNAIFAGTASINGDTAMGRGMMPLDEGEIKDYQAYTTEVKSDYIASETEDAKKTPFDIYNQYSFLGSLSRKLLPVSTTATASLSTSLSSVGSILSIATSSLLPPASAADNFNPDRFKQCDDDAYKDAGIDADVFCNVRYGLSDTELNMDTDTVVDYMVNKGYVDESGIPQDKYATFLTDCVNRTAGWGEEQDDGSTGKECRTKSTMYSNFRVFTMDNSINEAMEYDGAQGGPGINVMTFNILGEEQGKRNKNDSGFPMKKRADATMSIIQQYQPDIAGLQEVNDSQFDYIKSKLNGYDFAPGSSKGPAQPETIIWNSSVFTSVDQGTYTYTKRGGTSTSPWVKLQSISSGGYVYVFNMHPETGPAPAARKKAIQKVLSVINKVDKDNTPVVITGDFNATSYLRDIDKGTSVSNLPSSILEAAGYADTHDIAPVKTNDDYKSSHTDAGAPRTKDKTAGKQNKIDHIFVSSGVTANTWENIINDDSRIASDHTPLIANISIPGITPASAATSQTGSDIAGDDYRECSQYTKFYGGMCNGQCVSFVYFRLLKHKVINKVYFNTNGEDMVKRLHDNIGVAVNTTPAVHSVLSIPGKIGTKSIGGGAGHTAIVSKVNSDGSITVEEANAGGKGYGGYGQRTFSKAQIASLHMTFAHTEGLYK